MSEPTVTQHDRDEATKWLYGAHLEHWDLNGDPVDRLTELLARVRAEAEAATLLAAADFVSLLHTANNALTIWKSKPGNEKWWKRIDGTPIPNDLLVNIVELTAESLRRLTSSDAAAALARRDAETLRPILDLLRTWELSRDSTGDCSRLYAIDELKRALSLTFGASAIAV